MSTQSAWILLAELCIIPASFAVALCGFRGSGAPNTSDNNDLQSKELGLELFRQMMVPDGQSGPSDPGSALEAAVLADLSSRRPDLLIERSRSVADFAQYRHLAVFPAFRKTYKPVSEAMAALGSAASALPKSREASKLQAALRRTSTRFAAQDALTNRMVGEMPEEAILKVDLTVGQPRGTGDPHMEIGVSAKWSLRTDRAGLHLARREVGVSATRRYATLRCSDHGAKASHAADTGGRLRSDRLRVPLRSTTAHACDRRRGFAKEGIVVA